MRRSSRVKAFVARLSNFLLFQLLLYHLPDMIIVYTAVKHTTSPLHRREVQGIGENWQVTYRLI